MPRLKISKTMLSVVTDNGPDPELLNVRGFEPGEISRMIFAQVGRADCYPKLIADKYKLTRFSYTDRDNVRTDWIYLCDPKMDMVRAMENTRSVLIQQPHCKDTSMVVQLVINTMLRWSPRGLIVRDTRERDVDGRFEITHTDGFAGDIKSRIYEGCDVDIAVEEAVKFMKGATLRELQ